MNRKIVSAAGLLLVLMMLEAAALAVCPSEDAHRYGPWKIKTSATCTRQGHQFRYCQKCDHWEQRYTSKLPHTLEESTVILEPTCTQKGKREGICVACSNKVVVGIDMLEHAYGERVVTREPTCTKAGTATYTCADCGKKKTEKIEALGHSWGEWTTLKEPQGKKKGQRARTCTLCGGKQSEHYYPEGTLYEDMEPCEEVITLQEQLRDLGYYKGSIRSGAFGSMTTRAVERFQQEHGLSKTGLADEATRQRIQSAWEAQSQR